MAGPLPTGRVPAAEKEGGRLLVRKGELLVQRGRLEVERGDLRRRHAEELAALDGQLAATQDLLGGVERQLERLAAIEAAGGPDVWRDWGNAFGEGLPAEVLANVAGKVVAQTEAAWAAQLKQWGCSEEKIQEAMVNRKRDGTCLFVLARVCREWRKAQLKVGGPLRTRVHSDVIPPGRVALAKWALAEGCPREGRYGYTMAHAAARHGHLELVKWLCGEGGFAMDEGVMEQAAMSGNLDLVKWLRGEGCPWDLKTCYWAVNKGHVEVLRWVRENGCRWNAATRDRAAAMFGYTDDFGNLVG